jgi:Tfp pilus assembly protein PilO
MGKVFTPILLVIISIGLYFSYLDPAIGKIRMYQELHEKLTQTALQYKQLNTEMDTLQQKYEKISIQDEEVLNQILPDTIDPVRLILVLSRMILNSNLSINSFELPRWDKGNQILTEVRVGELQTSVLSIQVEGEYEQFKQFLKTLESSKRIIDIVGIEVENDTKSGTNTKQIYNVTMRVYWLS